MHFYRFGEAQLNKYRSALLQYLHSHWLIWLSRTCVGRHIRSTKIRQISVFSKYFDHQHPTGSIRKLTLRLMSKNGRYTYAWAFVVDDNDEIVANNVTKIGYESLVKLSSYIHSYRYWLPRVSRGPPRRFCVVLGPVFQVIRACEPSGTPVWMTNHNITESRNQNVLKRWIGEGYFQLKNVLTLEKQKIEQHPSKESPDNFRNYNRHRANFRRIFLV